MLDIKFIRENPEQVRTNTHNKHERGDVDAILSLDQQRRALIGETETLKNRRNVVTQEIAKLKKRR